MCANPVDEVLGYIEPTLWRARIQAADADVSELQKGLNEPSSSLMRLLERDPGLGRDGRSLRRCDGRWRAAPVGAGIAEDAPLQGRAGTLPRPHGQSAACDFASMAGWRLEELLLSA